ncbi:MAG: VWA domain-containing protein [Chloroflexota bacterium]
MDAPEFQRPPSRVERGSFRYARWDGSQRLDELSAHDVLAELSDDLLAESDLSAALARLLNRGLRGEPGRFDRLPGLNDLLRRLGAAREQLLARYQLGDVLADIRRELDEIVSAERRTVERRLAAPADGDQADLQELAAALAGRRQKQLESMPEDVAGRIRALSDYDFMEPDARERFDALMDRLGRQVLDAHFAGLSDAIRNVTPEGLAANREMVRELNSLLQERLAGGEPDVSEFLGRFGEVFPGAKTLDDIIEQLAARMAQMQSLMASLSPEQRQELQDMMDALLRDDRLRWDLAQLAATLDQLLPDGLGQRIDFHGAEELTLEGALAQLGQLRRLEQLTDQIGEVGSPAALDEIDPDELAEFLDRDAAEELRALQSVSRALEQAGYAERNGNRLTLTPRGARRVGQNVLDELFARLRRDDFGGHGRRATGALGERGDGSRAYDFGRPFDLHLGRTLANALARGERAPNVKLVPADFEIHDVEDTTRAATVLLVDMSRSMLLRGCFLAAKKVAMALDMLIRTRYPHDELHVVGFAYYAREIAPSALASLSWHGYEYGTNLQHGLMLARQLLGRSHAANRSVVVITDGEPTAHFEGGQVEFSYPPTRQTVRETLREVARCTRDGITINTFMLERSRALAEFVERMTRLNRGRAFFATPERLGEYVLVDYVGRRSRI